MKAFLLTLLPFIVFGALWSFSTVCAPAWSLQLSALFNGRGETFTDGVLFGTVRRDGRLANLIINVPGTGKACRLKYRAEYRADWQSWTGN